MSFDLYNIRVKDLYGNEIICKTPSHTEPMRDEYRIALMPDMERISHILHRHSLYNQFDVYNFHLDARGVTFTSRYDGTEIRLPVRGYEVGDTPARAMDKVNDVIQRHVHLHKDGIAMRPRERMDMWRSVPVTPYSPYRPERTYRDLALDAARRAYEAELNRLNDQVNATIQKGHQTIRDGNALLERGQFHPLLDHLQRLGELEDEISSLLQKMDRFDDPRFLQQRQNLGKLHWSIDAQKEDIQQTLASLTRPSRDEGPRSFSPDRQPFSPVDDDVEPSALSVDSDYGDQMDSDHVEGIINAGPRTPRETDRRPSHAATVPDSFRRPSDLLLPGHGPEEDDVPTPSPMPRLPIRHPMASPQQMAKRTPEENARSLLDLVPGLELDEDDKGLIDVMVNPKIGGLQERRPNPEQVQKAKNALEVLMKNKQSHLSYNTKFIRNLAIFVTYWEGKLNQPRELYPTLRSWMLQDAAMFVHDKKEAEQEDMLLLNLTNREPPRHLNKEKLDLSYMLEQVRRDENDGQKAHARKLALAKSLAGQIVAASQLPAILAPAAVQTRMQEDAAMRAKHARELREDDELAQKLSRTKAYSAGEGYKSWENAKKEPKKSPLVKKATTRAHEFHFASEKRAQKRQRWEDNRIARLTAGKKSCLKKSAPLAIDETASKRNISWAPREKIANVKLFSKSDEESNAFIDDAERDTEISSMYAVLTEKARQKKKA